MKQYDVTVYEVWGRTFSVNAENQEQAIEKANSLIESGDIDGEFEYSHTLDTELWYANELIDTDILNK